MWTRYRRYSPRKRLRRHRRGQVLAPDLLPLDRVAAMLHRNRRTLVSNSYGAPFTGGLLNCNSGSGNSAVHGHSADSRQHPTRRKKPCPDTILPTLRPALESHFPTRGLHAVGIRGWIVLGRSRASHIASLRTHRPCNRRGAPTGPTQRDAGPRAIGVCYEARTLSTRRVKS